MTDGYNFQTLKRGIIDLSVSSVWETAKREWDLIDVYKADEAETCLCSHYPIIEVCVLRNRLNKHTTAVGNVCVNKFLGLNSKIIFDSLRRVADDETKSLNADAQAFFFEKGVINRWEYGFLSDTWRKRTLSVKQAATRAKINRKVLAQFHRKGL